MLHAYRVAEKSVARHNYLTRGQKSLRIGKVSVTASLKNKIRSKRATILKLLSTSINVKDLFFAILLRYLRKVQLISGEFLALQLALGIVR